MAVDGDTGERHSLPLWRSLLCGQGCKCRSEWCGQFIDTIMKVIWGPVAALRNSWGWVCQERIQRESNTQLTQLGWVRHDIIRFWKLPESRNPPCYSIDWIISLLSFPIVHLCFKRDYILENERLSAGVPGRPSLCWISCYSSRFTHVSMRLLPHKTIGRFANWCSCFENPVWKKTY